MSQIKVKPIPERRREAPEQSVWWHKLSLAQKFSASSLGKFGYELTFVRNNNNNNNDHRLAILQCSSGVAVISENGDIDNSPNIIIR